MKHLQDFYAKGSLCKYIEQVKNLHVFEGLVWDLLGAEEDISK